MLAEEQSSFEMANQQFWDNWLTSSQVPEIPAQ
jgi:hypothetical protein